MGIYRPSELRKSGIRAKKSLSQNFLIDQNILDKIVVAASLKEGDTILEIGPGPGALTEKLLANGAHVIAIEKDQALAEKLMQWKHPRLKIICGDALDFPYETLPSPLKCIANLPYQITTPLLAKLVKLHPQISDLTVMVQKEVGERMTASKRTPEYGSFTVFLAAYAQTKYCFTVKPNSFYPPPSVYSCIVHLDLFPCKVPDEFFTLTRTAFQKRRKMLRNSVKELYPDQNIEEILQLLGHLPTTRPEELSFEEFYSLFQKLNTK